MTTLAIGASVAIILNDGGVCTIATNGGMASVTVTPTVGAASTVNIGPLPARQAFGPYAEGATVAIANQSAGLEYDSPSINAPRILAQSAVPASVTGTLVETVLASIVVPGAIMGPNGVLRITSTWSHPNNANIKRLIVNLGGATFQFISATTTNTSELLRTIRNRAAVNSQVSAGSSAAGAGSTGAVKVTAAINTAVDQVLTLSGLLADIADTITLEGYTVEVLPGY